MEAATTPTAASDEQQIRALYAQMPSVFDSWDGKRVADVTCAKFRDKALHVFDVMVPPMSTFGATEDLQAAGVDKLVANLAPKFSPAPEAEVRAFVAALVDGDNDAYTVAMRKVMKSGTSITVDKVENIVINGDTATANSTTTQKVFSKPLRRRRPTINWSARMASGRTAPPDSQ
ncbi:hypothetical protein KL864_00150 [Mycolicibacterium goodii]|uniref:hypothetical protein n=1 Tax=Mycolicibacterium goodii TaxID=134601 RepID=UPI001BDD2208|nr:hypothetical protein [Mycolicibacterium goodii]MBU8814326.1 hypothetical protein [Mycolicibacterium goodii]